MRPPVVIEPAIALLHGHEYPRAIAGFPAAAKNLVEVIADRADRLPQLRTERALEVTLLGHCTERATAPAWLGRWVDVLEAVGHSVVAPDVGCCGMAGIFGHEAANQEMSRQLFDLTWRPQLDGSGLDDRTHAVAATGYSCRSQAARLAGVELVHPVHLV